MIIKNNSIKLRKATNAPETINIEQPITDKTKLAFTFLNNIVTCSSDSRLINSFRNLTHLTNVKELIKHAAPKATHSTAVITTEITTPTRGRGSKDKTNAITPTNKYNMLNEIPTMANILRFLARFLKLE